MFSTLRNRFGIPGVISVIALVFAMFGGAYAASNSSGGGKATASAKAKQGPRGKTGKTGPAGPVGPAGPAGPAGVKGDAGAAGSNGTNGSPGSPGASVTASPENPGTAKCAGLGGSKFTVGATTTYACNGEEGVPGPEGSPWTDGGKLPVGATETGTWSVTANGAQTFEGVQIPAAAPPMVSISFPIPLTAGLDESHVHYVETPGGACTGSALNPTAVSGNLCIYKGYANGLAPAAGEEIITPDFQGLGAGPSGALINFGKPTIAPSTAFGSWAVTG
jgi:hypothetical protein